MEQKTRSRYEIYCDILYVGLINIRSIRNDPNWVFEESDHLHNLPELLKNLDNEELHSYYWSYMRIDYDRPGREHWTRSFDELWKELAAATYLETGAYPE